MGVGGGKATLDKAICLIANMYRQEDEYKNNNLTKSNVKPNDKYKS